MASHIVQGDVLEELYRIRRAYGIKSAGLVGSSFDFIEYLRRYLPWLWQPHWHWLVAHSPHAIEWVFETTLRSKKKVGQILSPVVCSIQANDDEEEDEGMHWYRVYYYGREGGSVISVTTAYDAARMIVALLHDD